MLISSGASDFRAVSMQTESDFNFNFGGLGEVIQKKKKDVP